MHPVRAALDRASTTRRATWRRSLPALSASTPSTRSGGSSTPSRTMRTPTATRACRRRSGRATPTAGRPASARRWAPRCAHGPRHPDAVPGPGAHRGVLVQRRGAARLDAAPPARRAAPAPPRPDRAAPQHRDTTRGLRGPNVRSTTSTPRRRPGVPPLAGRRPARRRARGGQPVRGARLRRTTRIGVPREGRWRVRFNSDWDGYDPEFATIPILDADARPAPWDGMDHRSVGLGPYSAVILSQDE